MLYGTVRYVLRSSPEGEVEVEWAGRVVFDFAEGVRMKFYQVYLVGFLEYQGDGMLIGRIRLLSRGRNRGRHGHLLTRQFSNQISLLDGTTWTGMGLPSIEHGNINIEMRQFIPLISTKHPLRSVRRPL